MSDSFSSTDADRLQELIRTWERKRRVLRDDLPDLYVRSSPETYSCYYCGEDLSYDWTSTGRVRVEHHKEDCPLLRKGRSV